MSKLSPSILNADFTELGSALSLLEENGVEHLHLDIMDGHYVPNLSFGPELVRSLRKKSRMEFDAHLMVENPDDMIDAFAEAGCRTITIHPETVRHLHRTLSSIRAKGLLAGVCLNPSTPPSVLEYVWHLVDHVLLMSVNPGFGGQSYIEETDRKILRIQEMIQTLPHRVKIQVDGGVKMQEAQKLKALGVDLIVVGSDIFAAENKEERIRAYQRLLTDSSQPNLS